MATHSSHTKTLLGLLGLSALLVQPAHAFFGEKKEKPAATIASGEAASASFVVVNVAALLADSKAGLALKQDLETKQNALQAGLKEEETALIKEKAEIEEKLKTAAEADATKLKDDFSAKVAQKKEDAKAKKEALDAKANAALTKLRDEILKIVKGIADEKGVKTVLAQQSVVLLDTQTDITAQAMEKLNASMPDLKMD